MPRWLKLALAATAAVVALVAIGLAVLVSVVDLEQYGRRALAEVRKATGRELTVGGRLSVSIFPQPAIVAENVGFANAPWGSRKEMAKAKRVELDIALLPLLRGEIRVARLVLVEPDVLLESDAKGRGNWVFADAPAPAAEPKPPGERAAFGIAALVVERGVLAWRPHGAQPSMLRIERLTLAKRALSDVDDIDLRASFRDQPFTLKGSMGSVGALLERVPDWPVDLAFATAGTTATAKGAIDWRTAPPAANATVKLDVRESAGVAKLAGGAAVPAPLVVDARLAASGKEQRADPITLTVGKTSATGRVSYSTAGPRPFLRAELKSPGLDLSGRPAAAPAKRSGRVFSDAPFPLDALRHMDGEAVVALDRLVLQSGIALDQVNARATLKGGRLEARPLAARLAGGALSGTVVLDATRGRAASLAVQLDGKGIRADQLSAALQRKARITGGSTDAAISLRGPGDSVRRFMAGSNGEIRLVMGPAQVTGLALEGGGDAFSRVLDAAIPSRRRDSATDVRCAVVRLPVRDGIATSNRTIAYETSNVNLVAAGTINLRNEALDLAIRPTVKEGIGIGAVSLAELVKVTGTLAEPSIGLDTLASARAALSVGGAVLTGGLSLLGQGLLSSGSGDPSPCQTALAGGVPARAAPTPEKQDDDLLAPLRRLFK